MRAVPRAAVRLSARLDLRGALARDEVWAARHMHLKFLSTKLVSEFLVREWAEHFRGMDTEQLDELAKSFKFEKCMMRDGLNKVLQENAWLVT